MTNLVQGVMKQTYEKAEECLSTNYYGVKRVTEALLPLLQLSPGGARIVNVSSLRSELRVSRHFSQSSFRHNHDYRHHLIITNQISKNELGDYALVCSLI